MSKKVEWYHKVSLIACRRSFNRGIDIAGVVKESDGKRYLIEPTTMFDTVHPEGTILEPCITLTEDEAQQLMNSLWDCGLRPSDIQDQSGELKATKYHLEDMRKLYFKLTE